MHSAPAPHPPHLSPRPPGRAKQLAKSAPRMVQWLSFDPFLQQSGKSQKQVLSLNNRITPTILSHRPGIGTREGHILRMVAKSISHHLRNHSSNLREFHRCCVGWISCPSTYWSSLAPGQHEDPQNLEAAKDLRHHPLPIHRFLLRPLLGSLA